ncbi:MAG TPA: hypothetical protein VGY57_14645, partial [Vicinamibacterales bacterium]|nr:hypothetical protein [Vicinamibacterales bacterium]
MTEISRRDLLRGIGAAGAARLAPRQPSRDIGSIVEHTSTSGVFMPPRGRSFQKFSFDFPEPSISFVHDFAFRVFTHENVYGLASDRIKVDAPAGEGGLRVTCDEFVWAGGQRRAPGKLTARLNISGNGKAYECTATASMDQPIKAIATIVRGIPRGRLSAGGAPFFDPRDDEILLGYPFSGGDLFGPQGNGGLT